MIEGEVVSAIRTLAARGIGKKAIAREVGVAVNTVRRYLRDPVAPGEQTRPAARRLTRVHREEARVLYAGPAAGNAVVVQRLLGAQGCTVSVRTVERAVADLRQVQRASALATVPNLFNEEFDYFDVDLRNPTVQPTRRLYGKVTLAF